MHWAAGKPAGTGLAMAELAALATSIFGGWLFYLTKRQQGIDVEAIDRDVMLERWAAFWADSLDQSG